MQHFRIDVKISHLRFDLSLLYCLTPSYSLSLMSGQAKLLSLGEGWGEPINAE